MTEFPDHGATLSPFEYGGIADRILALSDAEIDLMLYDMKFKFGKERQREAWGLRAIDQDNLKELRKNRKESEVIRILLSEVPTSEILASLNKIEKLKLTELYSMYKEAPK